MSAIVHLAKLAVKRPGDHRLAKISKLCKAVGFEETVRPLNQGGDDELVAVKMHFGETGNDTYLHPTFARQVVDEIKAVGGRPFLVDTCTLYNSTRHNAVDHLETAYRHGFTPYVVDAPVVIADGVLGKSYEDVPVNLKHFRNVHIAQGIRHAQSMVVLSHFKAHQMGGFGGALKNLSMGCAARPGKIDQHGRNIAVFEDFCIGCGQCVKVCPEQALSLKKVGKKRKAKVNPDACIGCYECITVCAQRALGIGKPNEYTDFVERMMEYAYGAVQGKDGRICFLNFVLNVTRQCDCAAWSEPPMVPDLGILASTDPVALDTACFDLVKQAPTLIPLEGHDGACIGLDKFEGLRPETRGYHQLEYAESIGLGTRDYELVEV